MKLTNPLQSETSKLTKHNNKSHLDSLHFCLGNETPGAGSSTVLALQGNLATSGLCEGN